MAGRFRHRGGRNSSCAMCHIRVMPGGTVIEGAQGDFPLERTFPIRLEDGPLEPIRRVTTVLVAAPWTDAPDDPSSMTREELAAAFQAIPPGVLPRWPGGLAPWDGSPRPVPGHPFGPRLSDEDRAALIAFLRTL